MPRAFLVKPRPLEQVLVTSESSRDVRLPSVDAAPWLQVDCDVNNNNVGRSPVSLGLPSVDLTVRPADHVARWSFDVAGGRHWWSMVGSSRSTAADAQPSWQSQRDTCAVSSDVTSSADRSISPPAPAPSLSSAAAAAAAAELATAADDAVQHVWWSASPHSDVSTSGINSVVTFISIIDIERFVSDVGLQHYFAITLFVTAYQSAFVFFCFFFRRYYVKNTWTDPITIVHSCIHSYS